MNRNTRTLVVLAVAIIAAGTATYAVYRAIQRIPVREVEVAHTFVVVAARALPTGAQVTAADVKLMAWPERSALPGSFQTVDQVVNRGVIAPLVENEPFLEGKLAPLAAGAGLPPTIPRGMRAISVRVNEVIGVAGFTTPGTRVDVFVTLKQNDTTVTRVVVSNVQVLIAGTRSESEKAKGAEAASSVVTLLLTPSDAERVVLASNDGQIMLALRNPLDLAATDTQGTRLTSLFGDSAPPAPRPSSATSRPVNRTPPPAVAPRTAYTVEAIRGAKRSEETIQDASGEDRP